MKKSLLTAIVWAIAAGIAVWNCAWNGIGGSSGFLRVLMVVLFSANAVLWLVRYRKARREAEERE